MKWDQKQRWDLTRKKTSQFFWERQQDIHVQVLLEACSGEEKFLLSELYSLCVSEGGHLLGMWVSRQLKLSGKGL